MHVYSTWLQTDAASAQVEEFAQGVGAPGPVIDIPEFGRLFVRALPFSDDHKTAWETSRTEGSWVIAVAEVSTGTTTADARLVGVLSTTSSLTTDLISQLEKSLRGRAAGAEFSLRQLLGASAAKRSGIQPRSVRINEGGSGVLIHAEDIDQLRQRVSDFRGELAGVTVQTNDQQVTILGDGHVVFSEAASPPEILKAMQLIGEAAIATSASASW